MSELHSGAQGTPAPAALAIRPYNHWCGVETLGELWAVQKGTLRLACTISTNPLGWELKTAGGDEAPRTHVCKGLAEIAELSAAWNREAHANGWT